MRAWELLARIARCSSLVCFSSARDSLVHRLASGESFIHSVPVSDRLLAQFPTEKNGLAIHLAGEIEQSDIQVFHLHADGIDLSDGILATLLGLDPLRLFAR